MFQECSRSIVSPKYSGNVPDAALCAVGIKYDYRKLSPEQQTLLRALSNLASMVTERWMNG